MLSRLTRNDKLLLGCLVPLYVLALGLHTYQVAVTGFAQLPVFAARVPSDYPVVAGFRLETDSRGSGLELGDRLIRLGDRDLRVEGYVSFDAIGLARTRPGSPAPLVIERGGVRRELTIEARPHPHAWLRIPVLAAIGLFAVLVLVRAPGSPSAQRFFVGFATYGIAQAQFYGGPEWLTWLAAATWTVFAPAFVFFLVRWARLFPDEMPESKRAWWWLEWLTAGAYTLAIRVSYLTGWPVPGAHMPRVSMAVHGSMLALAILLLAWNYAHAYPAGRRRLRWSLLGSAFGSLPLVGTLLMPLLFPDWPHFDEAFALGYLATAVWVLGFALGAARDNAFDVDRLLGATAAWTITAASALALLAGLLRLVSARISAELDLPTPAVQMPLAALMGALAVPVALRMRPRIDRVFFPERAALRDGSESLREELAECRSPAELLERLAERTALLLRAAGYATYSRQPSEWRLSRVTGLLAPESLPASLELSAHVALRNTPELLRRAGVQLVLPVARGARPEALLCLGAKRSGDIYTSSDTSELEALVGRTEALWLRFEKEAAEGESRAKTDLLAAASHDLRQPLHAVGLLAETLAARLQDEETRGIAERIGASTQGLDEMLTSLLDRSKLDSGAVRPDVGRVDLGEVLAQLERDFAAQAQSRGLGLRIVPTHHWVRTDKLLLLRILRNLVSNALRYTPSGAVLVGARRRGDEIRIEVRDSGRGIPESEQADVFLPFHQRPGSDSAGLGLGLSIVHGLAAVLGHPLELRSSPDRGSCFALRVPRTRAPAQRAVALAAAAPPLSAARVLVVDDDPAVRSATLGLLEGWGCEARAADSLASARAALRSGFEPDFVLADFHLRGSPDGTAVIEELRKQSGRALRAALVTAEAEPSRVESLRARGFAVLGKPVRPAALRALLSAR